MTDIVRARAEAMWAQDRATNGLGMRLDEVAPGRARLSMTVTETMTNGHGICHGGFIFTLADSAMAFAVNPRGEPAVAQHAQITFIRPAHVGETLVANCEEPCTRVAPACTTCASPPLPASLSQSSAATRAQSAVRRRDR
jgi:acyl-CoA thioesterase